MIIKICSNCGGHTWIVLERKEDSVQHERGYFLVCVGCGKED